MCYKVVYIGNLAKIAEYISHNTHYEIVNIICESNRINDDLLTYSLVRNVPILKVDEENKIEKYINKFSEEVIFIMCSYGKRVPVEKCTKHKIFNIHYAALPKYKGRHPSYWATVGNEKKLGVSIHIVSEEFDRGDIVAQKLVPYYLWENEDIIFEKLTQQVPELLDLLYNYLQGDINLIINNSDNYFCPIETVDITLDIKNDSPTLLFNKVRSQSRANGAIIKLEDRSFRIFDIKFTNKEIDNLFIEGDRLYIKYKSGICIASKKYIKEKE